jgi:hypothetical protein
MLRALTADAIFIAALFLELAALLSILQSSHAIVPREEFEPVLAFYRAHALPVLALPANVVWNGAPEWFASVSILSGILFFLFFIAQARNAMAPFGGTATPAASSSGAADRIEAVIDWALPAAFCASGALVLAPTLLPLLTVPAALILAASKLAGRACWFELSRSYYLNLLCLAAAAGAFFVLQR